MIEADPAAAFAEPKPSLDLSPFFAQVDLNHDGCINKTEWFGKGLPESAWNMLKDKKDCVTLKAMKLTPAPEGIDANKDAKLTLEEFLAFDRKGARRLPSP
jgi:hypothetical protein